MSAPLIGVDIDDTIALWHEWEQLDTLVRTNL